jgi:signal transduction histidine kinase
MTNDGHLHRVGLLTRIAGATRRPMRTVRLRLTLLYGGLFLVSGIVLLTITYLLVRHSTGHFVVVRGARAGTETVNRLPQLPESLRDTADAMRAQAHHQRESVLDQLLVQSAIALAIMSVASVGLGWLMAGRVLRPLRTMTTTARRISHQNLHERLALQGPRDELKDLGDTIDELLGRLEEAFDAQRRFVANASHELRTPLAMMRTSVDVATGKPDPIPPQVDILAGKVREGLDQADRLLDSFLALARAQDATSLEQETVTLRSIVGAALGQQRDAIADKDIRVRQDVTDAEVRGSRTLLARMIDNLVDNAVRHNDHGGWLRVSARGDERTATLVVENGGRRLRPEEVRQVAQPFRRVGPDRVGSENGIGLGLSIVAAIATAHAGELELNARSDGGLRAEVTLPTPSASLDLAESAAQSSPCA